MSANQWRGVGGVTSSHVPPPRIGGAPHWCHVRQLRPTRGLSSRLLARGDACQAIGTPRLVPHPVMDDEQTRGIICRFHRSQPRVVRAPESCCHADSRKSLSATQDPAPRCHPQQLIHGPADLLALPARGCEVGARTRDARVGRRPGAGTARPGHYAKALRSESLPFPSWHDPSELRQGVGGDAGGPTVPSLGVSISIRPFDYTARGRTRVPDCIATGAPWGRDAGRDPISFPDVVSPTNEGMSYRSPATRHETNARAIEPSASMAGLKMPTFTPTACPVAINTRNVALPSSQLNPPANPNRRISGMGNGGRHESERLPMRSQGRAGQCTPSHTGGPSDALDDSDPAAGGQG